MRTEEDRLKRIRMALERQERRDQLGQAPAKILKDWMLKQRKWDVAFSLHAADGLRAQQVGYEHYWMDNQVSTFFSLLSKVVYQHIPAKKRPKMRRLVTLEYCANVGWHAHGVIETPDHLTDQCLIEAMNEIWHGRMDDYCRAYFRDQLIWCEPIRSQYPRYSIKDSMDNATYNKDNSVGMISLRNTVL